MNFTKKKTLERRIERKNKSLSACRLEIALALSSPTAQHTYATCSALGTHKNKITLHFSLLKNMQTITGHNVTYATSVLSFSQEKQVGDRHHRLSKAEKVHSSLPFFLHHSIQCYFVPFSLAKQSWDYQTLQHALNTRQQQLEKIKRGANWPESRKRACVLENTRPPCWQKLL